MEPQGPKPPRPGSSPGLIGIRSPDQPEREAVHHPGVEDAPQAPPNRRGTLPGGMAAIPARASGEFAPTLPAPNPLQRQTVRRPIPPSAVAASRRSDPPTTTEPSPAESPVQSQRHPSPLPAPSQRPEDARVAAQAREIERLRGERDKAREEAEKAHARALEVASRPPPESTEGVSNETIGRIVREVTNAIGKKLGLPAVFMACLGGGGYAVHVANEKPVAPPVTAAELDKRLEKFEAKVVTRIDNLTTTQNGAIDVIRCVRKKTNQIGGSLLPAPDRMGAALKQSPYEDDCPDSPKKLPEPKQ